LIVVLGSAQEFKIGFKVLPSPARLFSWPGGLHVRMEQLMDTHFQASIKKPPWVQTRAVFS
jgi:hypothetical protein